MHNGPGCLAATFQDFLKFFSFLCIFFHCVTNARLLMGVQMSFVSLPATAVLVMLTPYCLRLFIMFTRGITRSDSPYNPFLTTVLRFIFRFHCLPFSFSFHFVRDSDDSVFVDTSICQYISEYDYVCFSLI